jgi:IKI3 family
VNSSDVRLQLVNHCALHTPWIFVLWLAAQMITVGWGKKETQFHGSQGKAAALNKTNVSLDYAFE